MPAPTTSLATLRPELGSMLEFDLLMNQQGFIWNRVLPVVDVQVQSGSFGKIPLEQLLQSKETLRAGGGGYGRGNWKFIPATFATEENGWEEPVDDREAKMYANYFDAEAISAARAAYFVLENAERRAAELIYNTTTWTGGSLTTALTNEWDDAVNATPINDVLAAKRAVRAGSGLIANTLICTLTVFENLRLCSQIIDRIASSGAGSATKPRDITLGMLAQALDLDQVIVSNGLKNTANQAQTAAMSDIWSDEYAMVCKVATSNDFREPCLGRTFHWSEDGSTILGTVETYRDERIRGDVVRVRHETDELILYPEAGHLLSNVTTHA